MKRSCIVFLAACGTSAPKAPPPKPHVEPVHVEAPAPKLREDLPVDGELMHLAVAHGQLVWTDTAGAIWTMHGQLSDQKKVFAFSPIVVGDALLATTNKKDLWRVTLPDGPVAPVGITGMPEMAEEAVADASAVYVTLYKRDEILRVPAAGGPAVKLMDLKRGVLAIHGDTLYAASYSNGTLVAVPTGGGKVRTIARGLVRPTALAVDDAHAYVYSEKEKAIRAIDLASGASKVIGEHLENSDELVLDGAWIYTVSWPHALVRVATDGSRTETLADDLASPRSVAIDGDWIYVTSRAQKKIVRFTRARGTNSPWPAARP